MYLSVYGSESLDELEAMVLDLFDQIPNRNKSMQIWEENPVKASLQERIDMLPLEDTRSLKLVFPIQYIQEIYKTSVSKIQNALSGKIQICKFFSQALEYIKYLLNLEGEGSLHNLLVKNKKWVESFSTVSIGFASGSSRGFTNFAIDFTLTKSGAEVIDKVILHLFKYLEMLREEEPQKWLWEEIRKIARIKQRFQDRIKPDNLVANLAVNLMV
jgi:insulysin